MRLDRAWIARRIPHHGAMCLLDEVIFWSAERISCRSGTHHSADNPLRAHGALGIACGIEYAAQTMAVHGALIAGDASLAGASGVMEPPQNAPVAGFLAGVRGVRFHVLRLDGVQGDLTCHAARIAGDLKSALYEFELRSHAMCLLAGRATVLLDANIRLPP